MTTKRIGNRRKRGTGRKPKTPAAKSPGSDSGGSGQKAPVPFRLKTIRLSDIRPDPTNRSIDLTLARFQGTRKAIRERGLLAPVPAVEEEEGMYRLVDGHLRFAVLQELGEKTVTALVYEDEPSEVQLRADQILWNSPTPRTPFERANEFQSLRVEFPAACCAREKGNSLSDTPSLGAG